MASRALVGFIGGFANTAKEGLERRETEEAERRKAELLNRLRMETDKELALFQDKLDAKKVSKDNSSIDASRGVRVTRNAKGEVIGEIPLTPTEIEAHRLSLDEARLTVEDKRSTIDSRALDDARADRLANAQIGMYARSGRDERDTTTGDKGNKILIAESDRVFSQLEEVVNPAAMAQFRAQFYKGVNELGWSERQQRIYLNAVQDRALKRWTRSDNGKTRPSLMETYPLDTRSLIPE